MEISLADLRLLFGKGDNVNPFSRWMGKNVFIRSVTHHYTGKITEVVGSNCAVLTTAAWIADDGRFTEALHSCEFNEVEMYKHPVGLNWGAVLDITEIDNLPRKQK